MLSQHDLLQRISTDLALIPYHLEKIIKTAPLRYKIFSIPKKSGGMREVAQPAREVKAIQRWVVREIGPALPVHDCAMAYRIGSSIRKNAAAHSQSKYMLKMDFENFFPSILRSDLQLHLSRHCSESLDPGAQKLIAHVCCWVRLRQPPLRLCIGAPTSPLFSNSVLYEFDKKLAEFCDEMDVTYTRYADDLTLSSKTIGKIDHLDDVVADILSGLEYPKLTINRKKTVRASRAGRRTVTGLVLTPDGSVSLGRDRKRLIRAKYHRGLRNQLSTQEQEELSGLLSFAESIEPGFTVRLLRMRKF